MSLRPDQTQTAAPPPEGAVADVADLRIVHAEERRVMLRELAELGMVVARGVAERATQAPEPSAPAPRHDPAVSFARVSRAIRLTLFYETRVEEAMIALRDGVEVRPDGKACATPRKASAADHTTATTSKTATPTGPATLVRGPNWDRPADRPRDYPSPRRNRIRDLVFEVVNGEITDLRESHEILDDLYERLAEGECYDEFVERPLREAVAAICEDLNLHPDWSRWTGEGWGPRPPDWPGYVWQDLWSPRWTPAHKRRRE